jgi:hypothetical protein
MIRQVTSPWDPGSFKPLDMRKIPGYPRQMPPISKKRWLPEFTGRNGERADFHMNDFYSYFQLHPVVDEAEDVVMILFANTLHGYAREWYYNLPDASITSMDQFEEVFLKKWGIKSEDIPILLKNFQDIKQRENETLFDFQSRFEDTLYQILNSHRPGRKYVVHHYTHAILAHLGVPLRKRAPKTLDEAYGMAKEIKNNIFSSGINDLCTSGTLTMESLYSHKDLVDDFQEEGKQTVIQHEQNEDVDEEQEPEQDDEVSTYSSPTDEVMQEPVSPVQQSEEEVSHFLFQDANDTVYSEDEEEMEASDEVEVPCCTIKDKETVHEDEAPVIIPQPDEALQDHVTPAQDEENEVSYFGSFDDALFYDSENEEGMETLDEPDPLCLKIENVEGDLPSNDDIQILEALAQEGLSKVHCSPFQVLNGSLPYDTKSEKVLDVLTPPCYDTDTDIADFDEFIHVGRRRWNTFGYDTDPIYDTESHLQLLPLQLS